MTFIAKCNKTTQVRNFTVYTNDAMFTTCGGSCHATNVYNGTERREVTAVRYIVYIP